MSVNHSVAQSLGERVAVLETEWPHLKDTVKGVADDLHAVRKQMEVQGRYIKSGLMLGAAAFIHLAGGRFADIAASILHFGVKLIIEGSRLGI